MILEHYTQLEKQYENQNPKNGKIKLQELKK